jgi:asparagine synthase (glutamine-hydrolysing)
LRRILDYHVPRELTDRPKMGFSVPIGRWLRGPLREWGCALIDEGRLKNEGYLRSETVSQVWDQHLGGQSDSAHQLWNVLMFQSWLENSSQ